MKWLILLMLVACGKHEEPMALDYRDSDGDHKPNYLEGDFEKYVADFETLKSIRGIIKYTSTKPEEVSFSNGSDLKEDTLKLVTGEIGNEERDQYFSEWSELKLTWPKDKVETIQSINTLHLYFEPTEILPDELVLTDGKTNKTLGKWSDYMKIQLTKVELNYLMNGKMNLALRKKFSKGEFYPADSDETIREKTYKVHTFDGQKSKIMYVAKDLPFKRLLEYLDIKTVTDVNDESLFFNSTEQSSSKWYQRKFSNGNRALIFSSLQNLRAEFYKKFNHKKINLQRVNGTSDSTLALENVANAKIYLTVRPVRTIRTFQDYTVTTQHRSGSRAQGSDDSWSCTRYFRKIQTETIEIPGIDDFFNNLNVRFEMNKDIKVVEQTDEKGIFWEIMISNAQPNLSLTVAGLNSSTFTTTGQHYVDCGHQGKGGTAATPTNPEGKLSFAIESFVEKIQ